MATRGRERLEGKICPLCTQKGRAALAVEVFRVLLLLRRLEYTAAVPIIFRPLSAPRGNAASSAPFLPKALPPSRWEPTGAERVRTAPARPCHADKALRERGK